MQGIQNLKTGETVNMPSRVRPRPSLMTIEPEVRLEILRNLLLLERCQTVVYTSAPVSDASFTTVARKPYDNVNKYAPGRWWSTIEDGNDTFLQTGLEREIKYRPSLQILRVCSKLKAEGEDILYKENHYIGIHDAPNDLINKLRRIGIGYRRWRGACDRLMPQPVLQIDFRPSQTDFRADRWLLLPPSDLGRLGTALYNSDIFTYPTMLYYQRMQIRILPGIRLLHAFGCKETGAVRDLIDKDFVDWIGTPMRGNLVEGMSSFSCRDREHGKGLIGPSLSPDLRNARHVQTLKADFDEAYEIHSNQSIGPALQAYLDVRDKIWFVARNCTKLSFPAQVLCTTPEYQLLAMLSWILYQIAALPIELSIVAKQWRVLFAHRALTLPSYVAATEWKVRISVLVAGILRAFPGLRLLRIHHMMRAGSLLELANDNPLCQQLCGLQTMITNRTWAAQTGVLETMGMIEAGLKAEMERKFGGEMVIRQGALDALLMTEVPDATMLDA